MKELELIKKVSSENFGDIYNIESEFDKKNVKSILVKLETIFQNNKIKFIIGEFSGGNDSGGFDHIYLADKDKKEITILPKDKEDFLIYSDKSSIRYYKENKEYSVFESKSFERFDLTDNNILETILLSSGCLDEWGSFAGEFTVNGTVEFDVFTGKWNCSGSESVEQYENFDREGEI